MTWDITDNLYDDIHIKFNNGVSITYVPKFRIYMVVEEPYLYLYWTDTELGSAGITRMLEIDYNDVSSTPASAAALKTLIESYIVSPFAGGGDVVGPGSATDNGIVLFDGTTGKLIKDSGLTLADFVEAGEFIFFLEDSADPVIATYKTMDNPALLLAETYVTQGTIADGQLIQSWITETGLPGTAFIPDGAWQFHINAYKTGGTKEVRLYAEVYTRDLAGIETLQGTTANSIPLTTTEAILPAFNIYIPAITLLDTDRIVVKVKMALIGGGSDPTSVTVGYSGSTAARLSIPVQAVDVTKFVRTSGDQTVAGVKTFTSSPIVPTPTTDFQAATKAYVDDNSRGNKLYNYSNLT